MPYPQCIKTYYQTTMMPKVPQRMGFYYGQTPKHLHYARTALKAPPYANRAKLALCARTAREAPSLLSLVGLY